MIKWVLLRYWFKIIISIIISVISNYATQCGLDDSQKDNFNDSLINSRRIGKVEIVVKAGDFTGHFESNADDFEEQHRSCDYGVRSKEGEKILKFCVAMNMTVGNTLVKNSANHLVSYESGASK